MSMQVDNRVVQMVFDNSKFERNVKTSMGTLADLNKGLSLTEGIKGFSNIGDAVKNINLEPLQQGVQMLGFKISAVQVAAITAFTNMANSAYQAGVRITKALTVDPIKSGFSEYETQINAVQTILANTESKGVTLDNVKNALAELNLYADRTIYNFTEMTRNIGTFTAAGVELDVAVAAIKGIANLAAVSGSNSQQASTAMYQLSQALASGTVKLMDWNSVVNAGMGGQVFQDSLKETARAHGIAIDDIIKKEGSFRETLQNGWLSADILTETLSKFTGDLNAEQLKKLGYTEDQIKGILKLGQTANDAATKVKTFTQLFDTLKEAAQSGWSRTWELIVGDFGEAKELLTEMSNMFGGVIGAVSDNRNSVLLGGIATGWNQLLKQGIADSAGFQDAIKEVAKSHGTDLEYMINDQVDFQDALKKTIKDGSIGSNTLGEAISKLAKKTEGLSNEQLDELGYTRQQIDELDKLNKSIQNGSVNLDDFVKKMAVNSGRENLIEALRNSLNGLMEILKPIGEGFREIFPAVTAEQLYAFTEKLKELTSQFHITDETALNIKNTFKGVFAIFSLVGQALKAIIPAIFPITSGFGKMLGSVLNITGSWGEWLSKLDETAKKTNFFGNIVSKVSETIKTNFDKAKTNVVLFLDKFKEFVEKMKVKFGIPGMELFINLIDRVKSRFETVKEGAAGLSTGLKSIFAAIGDSKAFQSFVEWLEKAIVFLQGFWDVLKQIGGAIGKVLGNLGTKLVEMMGNAEFSSILDLVNGGLLTGLLVGINKIVNSFDKFTNKVGSLTEIGDGIKAALKEIKGALLDTFTALQDQIKSKTLLTIATAIAILAGSLLVLSLIDTEKLAKALATISILFAELMGSISMFTKIDKAELAKISVSISTMLGMAIAIAVLSAALTAMAALDIGQIAKGVIGVGALAMILVKTAEQLSKASGTIGIGMVGLLVFSAAIFVLTQSVKQLSELDFPSLISGLVGVGVLCATMMAVMNNTKFHKTSIKSAVGLVIFAVAVGMLADSVKQMGEMNSGELLQGLSALLAVMFGISKIKSAGNAKDVLATAANIVILSFSMKVLASALKDFGAMKPEEISNGLIAMGGALVIVVAALKLMPADTLTSAIGLAAIGGALILMAHALKQMGSMTWDEITKGLVALAGGLLAISVAVYAMTGSIAGAAALIVVAIALNILAPALMLIGAMKWEDLAKGFVVLAVGIGTLAIVASLLTSVIPQMLLVAAAIALLGVGLGAIGLGIGVALFSISFGVAAIAVAVATLAGVGVSGAIAMMGAISIIVNGILKMIPQVFKAFGDIAKAFYQMLIDIFPTLVDTISVIILAIAATIVKTVPTVLDTLRLVFDEVILFIVDMVPKIVDGVLTILDAVMKSLVEKMPSILESLALYLLQILNLAAEYIPDFVEVGVSLISAFITGIGENAPRLADAAFNAMITFINALSTTIDTNTPLLVEAMNKLARSLVDAFLLVLFQSINPVSLLGSRIGSAVGLGIRNKIEDAKGAIKDLIDRVKDKISETVGDFTSLGQNVIDGFVNGIRSKIKEAVDAATDLGNKVVSSAKKAFDINSPSKKFIEIGKSTTEGLVVGIKKYASDVYSAAGDIAVNTTDTMRKSFSGLSNIVDGNFNFAPVIRPTLDLTDVTNGVRTISSMFNRQRVAVTDGDALSDGSGSFGNNINYTQNIYSPKAVSRTEIYRQTKNLFATSKGLVNGV